jgi:hypothetical protein
MRTIIQFLSASLLVVPAVVCAAEIQQGEMAGYVPIATRQELAGAASHPNDQEKARQ